MATKKTKAEFKEFTCKFINDLIAFAQKEACTFHTLCGFIENQEGNWGKHFAFSPTEQLEMAKEFYIFSKILSIYNLSFIVKNIPMAKISELNLKSIWKEEAHNLFNVATAYKKELDGSGK